MTNRIDSTAMICGLCWLVVLATAPLNAQSNSNEAQTKTERVPGEVDAKSFSALKFRNIGPFRGGRCNAITGVVGQPMTYYMGSTGGGVWKTTDAGMTWKNISDGSIQSGSVGAIAVAPNDANVLYVGMGEHAVRGVMTSHGDGVYKSTDAGKTWQNVGLPDSRHIAAIRIHPDDHNLVYVAVQGAVYTPTKKRGVYRSQDGGTTWQQVLFINETTGAADLSIDPNNPRILYAGMWDHQRTPWSVRSGGPGSGIHQSKDGGTTWTKLSKGLPAQMGKVAVDVSAANPQIVYANIEAKKGGVFRSDDGGGSWKQVNSERTTVARAWYYIEVFADPKNENEVYVLNAPVLKSIDGGKTFQDVPVAHTDQHDMWINPNDPRNIALANDGGACVTFNGGKSWSTQNNQPTAQFYRVITDNQFPYRLYAGQQDNSTVSIASRSAHGTIGQRDWFPTAGGESAFLAFDPDQPDVVFGTTIQGMIDKHILATDERKSVMVHPQLNLGTLPKDQKYRFNWNGPLTMQVQDPSILYHGGNVLFKSLDGGAHWTQISGDLTRNEVEKHGDGGTPYTNEAAGGEVYNTISYIAASPHAAGTIWVGSDDGLVHLTHDEGKTWKNVTPPDIGESLINAIEVSPHDPATAFLAVTRYKFDDLRPMAYVTRDNGQHWTAINDGIDSEHFVRAIRQDPVDPQILYAGTEGGLYLSTNGGKRWNRFQLNLPITPITDLALHDNDLIVATSGRSFWILDDLAAIQQSQGNVGNELKLYTPKPSVKFDAATAAGPNPTAGTNPQPGVIFDYVLPADWTDKQTAVLEISDADGNVLRSFTSKKVSKPKTWTGGPEPAKPLPAKPGLNRFHWDLRTEPVAGINNVFMFGSHNGPRVTPGTYTLKLRAADQTAECTATVTADPRVEAEAEDYRLQAEMLGKIRATLADIHTTVNQYRQVKSQVSARLAAIRKMAGTEKLVQQGQAINQQLNAWEQQLIQPSQKTFQDVINFPNRLNAQLVFLAGQLDTNDPQTTQGCRDRLAELVKQWETQKSALQAIVGGPIAQFNQAYRAQDLPALIIPDSNDK